MTINCILFPNLSWLPVDHKNPPPLAKGQELTGLPCDGRPRVVDTTGIHPYLGPSYSSVYVNDSVEGNVHSVTELASDRKLGRIVR